MIEIYCDGSSKGNGKNNSVAGFGVCVLSQDQDGKGGARIKYMYKEQHIGATNNEMELRALLFALKYALCECEGSNVIIKSDSAYCVNMFNDWIYKWYRNEWKRSGKKDIENLDLVKQIWEYCKIDFPNFRVERVSGHAGILGNEIADALATDDEAKLSKILKDNEEIYEK